MKKRVIKSIVIILDVVIVILGINFFRNYMIITELNNNRAKYVDNTNYHMTETIIKENHNEIRDVYKKGDKKVSFLEIDSKKYGQTKTSRYWSGDKVNKYDLINKTAILASKSEQSNNLLFSEDYNISLTECLLSIINKCTIEDKECYKIQKIFVSDFAVIHEKETGLPIEIIFDETTGKMKYEFGEVKDSIFIEPDLSEYVIENDYN